MSAPEAELALARFAASAAALVLWGASAYLAWLVPPRLAAALWARLRGGLAALAVLAAAATAAELPVEAAVLGGGWGGARDPSTLLAALTDTAGGRAWAVGAGAALALLLVPLAPARARPPAAAVAAASMLAAIALTGHALMREGWPGATLGALSVLHLLAAGAWFGALVPVLLVLPRLGGAEDRGEAVLALRAFSRAGHAAVALVLLTGAGQSALVLGRWPTDLGSPYEALLDAKVAAVAAMAVLALANRYLLVPRLGRARAARPWLRRLTLAELPLALVAVALVAVFGLFDPG